LISLRAKKITGLKFEHKPCTLFWCKLYPLQGNHK
jgi:hypothetical protein